ncbi:DUF5606 family protein [Membranihabitans marinus]|uniref:DUF5606 family protein n=1 Tax=Membranihabitans marinus TaxID=1227546 RepID=UPI001F2E8DF0|nr:DUF5606 domain-containing protein [Membranihabitans marinus]
MSEIKDLLAVSGLPGLFRLIATKNNGIIVASMQDGQKKFLSTRSYQFSPLESIAIYTDEDAIPLSDVFLKMKDHPPKEGITKSEYRDYFSEVLPNYDQDKVYASDIKKIIAWYLFLDAEGIIEKLGNEESDETLIEDAIVEESGEEE